MVGAEMGKMSESVNKRNIHAKMLFQIVLNEVVNYDICWCKNWYKTIRTKRTGDCIIKNITRSTFKTLNTM